jgi:hypothetical protein
MELIKETKQIHLSTVTGAGKIKNADANYKSQIEFNIPNLIKRDEDIEYIMFSVPYAIIPVSFYTINDTNNRLEILLNGATSIYTFRQGNYTANQFITEFNNIVTGYTLSLDAVTSKFTVTSQQLYNYSFLGSSTIDYIMGFSGTITSYSVLFNVRNIIMPRVCNFLPLPRINMRCNVLANSTMTGTQQTNDLVITIPNNSRPNGEIVYTNSSNIQMLFQQDTLSTFVVSLTNDTNQLINFNGVSSFWVFQFDIYRKKIDKPLSFYKVLENVNKENLKKDLAQEQ